MATSVVIVRPRLDAADHRLSDGGSPAACPAVRCWPYSRDRPQTVTSGNRERSDAMDTVTRLGTTPWPWPESSPAIRRDPLPDAR